MLSKAIVLGCVATAAHGLALKRATVAVRTEAEVEHPQLAHLPKGDFHKDHPFQIGFAPSSYREAIYWDSPATSFFQMGEQAEVHNVLEPIDVPDFEEARYEDQDFFGSQKVHANDPDFTREHPFQIGFVPDSFKEALYWDSPASAFFEMSAEYTPGEMGEDFKISPHGRTEDVNNPDFEINHPTDHKHTKNVIGTKQEGALFWTDTVQPNMKHYESTFDQRVREANTESSGSEEQAFSSQVDTGKDVDLPCPGCPTSIPY